MPQCTPLCAFLCRIRNVSQVYQSSLQSIETIGFFNNSGIVLKAVSDVLGHMKVQNHYSKTVEKTNVTSVLFRTFAVFFIFVLCANAVHATIVDSVIVKDTIEGVAVRETMTIVLTNNTLSNVSFGLPQGVIDITVDGKAVIADNGTIRIPLFCKSCNFTVGFTLQDAVTSSSADVQVYSRTMNAPGKPKSLVYELHLPAGAFIRSTETDPAIVPIQTAISTDGEHIVLRWSRINPQLPEQYVIRYMTTEPNHIGIAMLLTEFSEWIVWVLMGIALVIGILVGLFLPKKLGKSSSKSVVLTEQSSAKTVPSSLLSSDEILIIKALRDKPLDQKELGKQLNWSKSKVSAIMSGLERKEIIKREKLGRKFKAELLKDVEE